MGKFIEPPVCALCNAELAWSGTGDFVTSLSLILGGSSNDGRYAFSRDDEGKFSYSVEKKGMTVVIERPNPDELIAGIERPPLVKYSLHREVCAVLLERQVDSAPKFKAVEWCQD